MVEYAKRPEVTVSTMVSRPEAAKHPPTRDGRRPCSTRIRFAEKPGKPLEAKRYARKNISY